MTNIWPAELEQLTPSERDELYAKTITPFEHRLEELAINKQLSTYLTPFYIPFAAWLHQKALNTSTTLVVGINGAQGSGKSTMSQLVADVLQHGFGLRTVIISIDDIYKTRQQRKQMAESIHPLFNTRGAPGTHDTAMGIELIQQIKALKQEETLSYPRFDKGNDDRQAQSTWPQCRGPIDILIFEGWCVGAQAQADQALTQSVNFLELTEDKNLTWRRAVNKHLQTDYKLLFNLLDCLVFLQIPSFDCVLKWRGLQEQKLVNKQQHEQHLMTSQASLERFIAHYERLTLQQLDDMPSIADLIIQLGADHQIEKASVRNP